MTTGQGRIVVVGNGMVGHRLSERLVERGLAASREITVFGEEPRAAYDRVHLSEFFGGRGPLELALTSPDWYKEHGLDLQLGRAVVGIDRNQGVVEASGGARIPYDTLVLASGSAAFVPPIPGVDLPGVFLYRTIDDLGEIQGWARTARRAAVIGGGLLGLEAAKALLDMGLEAHVVEVADRLMPRQLDAAGSALLQREMETLGVQLHLGMATQAIVGSGGRVTGLRFPDRPDFPIDMVIVSAGIRPRDELARECGLAVADRGGIVVDDTLQTDDPRIFAIGECAVHRGVHYGLVGPGYEMADVLAKRLAGEEARFQGADLSARLKLLGVDVASFGEPFADLGDPAGTRTLVFEDRAEGVYQKLVFDDGVSRLLGGILVGDASAYAPLQALARSGGPLPERPRELLFASGAATDAGALPSDAQVCSCNDVTKADLVRAIAEEGATNLAELKSCTRAATGCGGCQPVVLQVLEAELARQGVELSRHLCEHFPYTRQELLWIVKLGRIESFDALLDGHGRGDGCEVCKPAVASLLASTWNDLVLDHATIQDTNDRFLANIQRGGTYSVIPRVPGGEITPEKLITLGEVARKHDLYCKITGGQRIDLLGARVDQLPEIWQELVAAGFESGHAYGKAMRTVKSCVGSTWCRYGVQDSTAFAIRIEERYRGVRAPHKLKSAVSGCIRECAEAQNKDFGLIATEQGWNLYLCGNGGSHPRHGDLFATDLSEEQVIRALDRFLMFYIQTAKPLQRTARWLEEFEGGIERLRTVVLEDELGIGEQLEADMQLLVDAYHCEWKAVVESPELRARFRHYGATSEADEGLDFVRERGQRRPADWGCDDDAHARPDLPPEETWTWQAVGHVDQFPPNGGTTIRYGRAQLAVFYFARRNEWYATQAMCPHRKDHVLGRGLLGDQTGEPKVACPLHKKTFSLHTGKGLSDPGYEVRTFPVQINGAEVWLKLPPADALERALACEASA